MKRGSDELETPVSKKQKQEDFKVVFCSVSDEWVWNTNRLLLKETFLYFKNLFGTGTFVENTESKYIFKEEYFPKTMTVDKWKSVCEFLESNGECEVLLDFECLEWLIIWIDYIGEDWDLKFVKIGVYLLRYNENYDFVIDMLHFYLKHLDFEKHKKIIFDNLFFQSNDGLDDFELCSKFLQRITKSETTFQEFQYLYLCYCEHFGKWIDVFDLNTNVMTNLLEKVEFSIVSRYRETKTRYIVDKVKFHENLKKRLGPLYDFVPLMELYNCTITGGVLVNSLLNLDYTSDIDILYSGSYQSVDFSFLLNKIGSILFEHGFYEAYCYKNGPSVYIEFGDYIINIIESENTEKCPLEIIQDFDYNYCKLALTKNYSLQCTPKAFLELNVSAILYSDDEVVPETRLKVTQPSVDRLCKALRKGFSFVNMPIFLKKTLEDKTDILWNLFTKKNEDVSDLGDLLCLFYNFLRDNNLQKEKKTIHVKKIITLNNMDYNAQNLNMKVSFSYNCDPEKMTVIEGDNIPDIYRGRLGTSGNHQFLRLKYDESHTIPFIISVNVKFRYYGNIYTRIIIDDSSSLKHLTEKVIEIMDSENTHYKQNTTSVVKIRQNGTFLCLDKNLNPTKLEPEKEYKGTICFTLIEINPFLLKAHDNITNPTTRLSPLSAVRKTINYIILDDE